MHKKLMTACMALVAFAALAIAPAIASAKNDPQLTHPTGTLIPVGTKVLATNVGNTLFVDANNNPLTTCSVATMTGTILKNSGGNVEGEITTANFSGTGTKSATEPNVECTGSFGNVSVTPVVPMCIRSTTAMNTDVFQVVGGKCSAPGKVKFTLASTTVGNCVYEGNSVDGTFHTHPSDAVFTVPGDDFLKTGFPKVSGSFLCPSEGFLDMDFTLETENGEPIYIS